MAREVALAAQGGQAVHLGQGLGQALAADAAVGHEELGRLGGVEQAGVRLVGELGGLLSGLCIIIIITIMRIIAYMCVYIYIYIII